MFILYQSFLFSLIRFLQYIKPYGSIWGLILVHVVYGLPIATLIFCNYYSEGHTELIKVTQIDGVGSIIINKSIYLTIELNNIVEIT